MEPLREDPTLRELMADNDPVSLTPADDPFARLVVSVINQQLSTASAAAIKDRVFAEFEISPAGLLEADEADLQAAGLSAQKVDYLNHIAEAHQTGRIDRDRFADMSDDAVIDHLTDVRGVGVWTAKMYLLFCLGREDVFPVEDLGIRRAMSTYYGIDDRENMVEKSREWSPYRSYASVHLWRATD